MTAIATSLLTDRLLRRSLPGEPKRWLRTNHRHRQVSLREGPAMAAGLLASSVLAPGLGPRVRMAVGIAVGGAAAAGAYDDIYGDGSAKGLRGHFAGLARGRVSTGTVKVAAIGSSAWVAARALSGDGASWEPILDAALIAGCANVANLFDLRPGRALKAALLAAAALASAGTAPVLLGAVCGSIAVALPGDLAERTMLGDCGANALGAAVGCAAAAGRRRSLRWGAAVVVVALTLLSERISFSAVIDGCPPLAAIDALGRRSC